MPGGPVKQLLKDMHVRLTNRTCIDAVGDRTGVLPVIEAGMLDSSPRARELGLTRQPWRSAGSITATS